MSNKIIVTCEKYMNDCVVSPYVEPVFPSHYAEYGFSGTTITWGLIVTSVLVLALIVGIGIVRYKAHEEKGLTDRRRIDNPPKECPNCYAKVTG